MEFQTVFKLHTDHNKSKNSKSIFKFAKKKKKKIYTKQTSTAATTDFLSKFPDAKKMSNEHFNLCDTEMS